MSGNDGGSSTETETETDVDGDFERLEALCDEIGADFDNAKARVANDSGVNLSDLIDYAKFLAENPEAREAVCEYRCGNDISRFIKVYLRDADGDWSKANNQWAAQFWDSYAEDQERSRDIGGNLYYQKVLFPTPDVGHWPAENVVEAVHPDGHDTPIYFTQEFVEAYGDYTITLDGKEVPRPPSVEEINAGQSGGASEPEQSGGSNLPLDPEDYTVQGLKKTMRNRRDEFDTRDVDAVLQAEKQSQDRGTAVDFLEDELDRVEDSGGASEEQQSLDEAADDSGASASSDVGERVDTLEEKMDTILDALDN
jgi:hypothetical protein